MTSCRATSRERFDFDNNTEHEFVFEVGLAPEIDIELSEKDKLTKYKIKVSDEMREGYRTISCAVTPAG